MRAVRSPADANVDVRSAEPGSDGFGSLAHAARAPAGAPGDDRGDRYAGLGVPVGGVVVLLEALEHLLDPGVVAEQLADAVETAAEDRPQDRVEERHRVPTERPTWPARLEEMDRRRGQPAELDLARDLLHQLVPALGNPFGRHLMHRRPPRSRQ